MNEQQFEAGQVFFVAGDAADCAYQLRSGAVELVEGADGEATATRQLGPGDVFGELALIDDRPRPHTARAINPGRVMVMTRDEFEDGLLTQPARTLPYVRALFEQLKSRAAASLAGTEHPPASAAAGAMILAAPSADLPLPAGLSSDWVMVIHPLSHKAAATLPDEGLLISQFPLRIGRASDDSESEARDLNDLWLIDQKPYHVSRNHCEIVADAQGLIVRDRGSYLGCIVNDEPIGGRIVVNAARLNPGENVLVIGTRMTKYQFRILVQPAAGT